MAGANKRTRQTAESGMLGCDQKTDGVKEVWGEERESTTDNITLYLYD